MGLCLGIRITIALKCPGCGLRDGHTPDCPAMAIQDLKTRQKWLDCSECGAYQVDRNDDDLFECRVCHTQYQTESSGPRVELEGTGTAMILDENTDEAYKVRVLREKGSGKFSIDRAIEEFQKQINARIARLDVYGDEGDE